VVAARGYERSDARVTASRSSRGQTLCPRKSRVVDSLVALHTLAPPFFRPSLLAARALFARLRERRPPLQPLTVELSRDLARNRR